MDSGFVKYNEEQEEENLRMVHQRSHSVNEPLPEIRMSAQPSIEFQKTFTATEKKPSYAVSEKK